MQNSEEFYRTMRDSAESAKLRRKILEIVRMSSRNFFQEILRSSSNAKEFFEVPANYTKFFQFEFFSKARRGGGEWRSRFSIRIILQNSAKLRRNVLEIMWTPSEKFLEEILTNSSKIIETRRILWDSTAFLENLMNSKEFWRLLRNS